MSDQLTATRYPGIYAKDNRYVVRFRQRGKQHKKSFRSSRKPAASSATRTTGRKPYKLTGSRAHGFVSYVESVPSLISPQATRQALVVTACDFRRQHALEALSNRHVAYAYRPPICNTTRKHR